MTEHFYLDSSVAVRILYGDVSAARWFDEVTGDDDAVVFSSRLLRTELTRVLRRDRKPLASRDEIVDYLSLVPIDDVILAEAEAIVPHIKTLDAIHLASLIHTGIDATVVTHDDTMRAVAETIGFRVFDPVAA
ncbi:MULTISPECIES: type II toxin-antitoxin system VapC family toxin [Microbacterium]|uniref:type II toxin-antitoxin system VapC family toxin n=1 Tax=Microbacterium TaxID=33882 RepID=UPI00248E2E56|nr:type II toxin-antitoxin system VapC family toxin [Microbacterium aurum]